jgi:hypothetical protein
VRGHGRHGAEAPGDAHPVQEADHQRGGRVALLQGPDGFMIEICNCENLEVVPAGALGHPSGCPATATTRPCAWAPAVPSRLGACACAYVTHRASSSTKLDSPKARSGGLCWHVSRREFKF